jgi:hypothetical protein
MSNWFGRKRLTWWRSSTLAVALGALILSGCTGETPAGDVPTPTSRAAATVVASNSTVTPSQGRAEQTLAANTAALALAPLAAGATTITLGETISVSGAGATVDGSTVTITAAGAYHISGTLADGQIVVNTEDKDTVQLVLDGASITSFTSAPIYVVKAKTTAIVLADGSENYVADGDSYVLADAESNEPNAAIFSKGDLIIGGNGSLTVAASYNDGITSRDELTIVGGDIRVTAVSDGIRGKDFVVVTGGNIAVKAGNDGLKSTNDEDPEKGYVLVQAGTLDITAGRDGIQGETRVLVDGGHITITAGGGSANFSGSGGAIPGGPRVPGSGGYSGDSAKGIKAGVDVTIVGGTITIDSLDDGIHSNDSLTIDGGKISIASGDDGMHADAALTINGGDINITRCYEGIESQVITINDGNIRIVARDDGINAASGNGGFAPMPRPGQNTGAAANYLYINGGYIVVDAAGDGIDVNGYIEMTGGTVIINGPTVNMEGALDYDRGFKISGGTVIAVGSAGMAQAPDATSTQYSVMVNLPAAQPAGTMVRIEAKDGKEMLTFAPTKTYQSVVFSSPELKNGSIYNIYTGGSSTGSAVDGSYSGGTYTGGTQVGTFTISGAVTTVGSAPRGAFPAGQRR